MSDDLTHPSSRIVHAVNNALQILLHLDALPVGHRPDAVVDAVRLLEPVLEDVAVLQQYIDVQESNLRTMAQESLEAQRELTAEREKTAGALDALREANDRMAAVHADIEQLYTGATMDLERHSNRFNAIVRIRGRLDPMYVQPIGIHRHEAPRAAAAGSH